MGYVEYELDCSNCGAEFKMEFDENGKGIHEDDLHCPF